MPETAFIGFKLARQERDRLFERAEADACTRSQIIRAALVLYLDEPDAAPESESAADEATLSKNTPTPRSHTNEHMHRINAA